MKKQTQRMKQILQSDWLISPSQEYGETGTSQYFKLMNSSSISSTLLTIQKSKRFSKMMSRFLSAFLDRLSKVKFSIETINPSGKEVEDSRQFSTRIIQQWNTLFPNSPVHCIDTLSSNTLIATKTR